MPDARYQATINLLPERLEIEASELAVGEGKLRALTRGTHSLHINSAKLDADRWIELAGDIYDKQAAMAQGRAAERDARPAASDPGQ